MLYFSEMAGADKNPLDRAETVARRILERLGDKAASKISTTESQGLSVARIHKLVSQLESAVEANLRDQSGIKNLAPNSFRVLLTYEETSGLAPKYMEAVGKELTSTVYEYIHNRRYQTPGPVAVTLTRDVLATTTTIKAEFEAGAEPATDPAEPGQDSRSATVCFGDRGGRNYRVSLALTGESAYAGRASGIAIHLDDTSVSRMHCSLVLQAGGRVLIADLGSANGTYVNEQQLAANETRPLKTGDVVRLGDYDLTVIEIDLGASR